MAEETPENSQTQNTAPARRPVEYQSLAAVWEDAKFLAEHPHQTVGSWSYGKILQHLADSFNRSIDGFGWKAS